MDHEREIAELRAKIQDLEYYIAKLEAGLPDPPVEFTKASVKIPFTKRKLKVAVMERDETNVG